MNQGQDWEKRARELCLEIFKEHAASIWSAGERPSWADRALQLGREMADEAFGRAVKGVDAKMREAADARAEEIAKAIGRESIGGTNSDQAMGLMRAEQIARSTITKPAPQLAHPPLWRPTINSGSRPLTPSECRAWGQDEGAMVSWDETGFEIIGPPKPKTREQALEEALREIVARAKVEPTCAIIGTAQGALEWKAT